MGRSAKLGDLYDWPTHRFTGQSLFRQPIDEKLVDKINIDYTAIDQTTYTMNTYREKFEIFSIRSPDIKFSMLTELFPFAGYSKIFTKKSDTIDKFQSYWTFTHEKRDESIYIKNDDFQNLIDNNTLLTSNSTHVVNAITYGLTAVFYVETKYLSTTNPFVMNQKTVDIAMKTIQIDTLGKQNKNKQYYDKLEEYVSFAYYSDNERNHTPDTLFEAIQYLREDYKLAEKIQLKPIRMTSISLESLRNFS